MNTRTPSTQPLWAPWVLGAPPSSLRAPLDSCGPPWSLVGRALVGPWALVDPLGPCGSGPCGRPWALVGPPGPLWAGPLWASLGLCGPPWALAGRALSGPPGPLWARP